jgi:hypothetical protein
MLKLSPKRWFLGLGACFVFFVLGCFYVLLVCYVLWGEPGMAWLLFSIVLYIPAWLCFLNFMAPGHYDEDDDKVTGG